MIIKNRIKYCRESLSLTQSSFGKIFKVSKTTISDWENCLDDIPLKKLVYLCNKFNYSIDYILCLSNKNNKYTKCILNKSKLGKKIRIYREKLQLTQQELANQLCISHSCISQYENRKNLPTTSFIYTFCYSFNFSIDEMLDRALCLD